MPIEAGRDQVTQTQITDYDIEFEETDTELIIAMPAGHGFKDPDQFFNEMLRCLTDMGFSLNGYENIHLFIQSDDRFYNGASYCNCWVWNAIEDIYKNGYCVLHRVTDPDDISEIIEDWF